MPAVAEKPRGKRKRKRIELRVFDPRKARIGNARFRSFRVDKQDGERVFVFLMEAEDFSRVSLIELDQIREKMAKLFDPHHTIFVAAVPGVKVKVFEVIEPLSVVA